MGESQHPHVGPNNSPGVAAEVLFFQKDAILTFKLIDFSKG